MAEKHKTQTPIGTRCHCYSGGSTYSLKECGAQCQCCDARTESIKNKSMVNRQLKAVPKLFGKRNKPLKPQTKAGTAYILSPAGSGNTPERNVSLYPTQKDILMNPNR